MHTCEGKRRIIKILAVEVQHNSDNKYSQASAEDIMEAKLGRDPNKGEKIFILGSLMF